MDFVSADPSVVRSVKQRDLLDTWLRARGPSRALPALADYRPDRIDDELEDMMGFDVEGEGLDARFVITQEGARLASAYGKESVNQRTNRYLDGAIGAERYARTVPSYRACLTHLRPTYSILMLRDPDAKEVSYERLLLPFGSAGKVEQIVGSYKAISIDGGFKLKNLLGARPKTAPVTVLNAVIDLAFVPRRAAGGAPGDLIELS